MSPAATIPHRRDLEGRPAVRSRREPVRADTTGRPFPAFPCIPACPGLKRTARGAMFKDAAGTWHDLGTEKRLRPKEVSADTRVSLTPADVRTLISSGEIYPVFRRNARRIEVFACAVADWWLRQSLKEVKSND